MSGRRDGREQDWRLEVELHVEETRPVLERMIHHLHRDFSREASELRAGLPAGMVVTHDGTQLFAYSAAESDVYLARRRVHAVLARHELSGTVQISRWDALSRRWWHVDPAPEGYEKQLRDTARWIEREDAAQDSGSVETRTLVANVGKFIRPEFEETMLAWAQRLGVECRMLEHPHLLTTQVAFEVAGPRRKIDEFWQRLVGECGETIARNRQTMVNPLAPVYAGRPPAPKAP